MSAKRIAWPIIRELNLRFDLRLNLRESTLEAVFPNGSVLSLYGADRPGWAERMYGQRLSLVIVDEAAFYAISLRDFKDDYIEPALADERGQLMLCSIPGHQKRGFFWDVSSGTEPGWSVHRWTTFDNPHLAVQFREQIDRKIALNPDIVNDPKFRRNYRAEWVNEARDLVYQFDDELNLVPSVEFGANENVTYTLGLDLGWHDATAFSLTAYSDKRPQIFELESYKRSQMLVSDVCDRIKGYERKYPNLTVVGDPSRRQLLEEIRTRQNIPVIDAVKTDKLDWIDLKNTDYTLGIIKLVESTTRAHQKEAKELRWFVHDQTGKRKETDGQPNDCCDAFLYAYRNSYPYLYKPEVRQPDHGTAEYWAQEERRMEEQLLAEHTDRIRNEW